MQVFIYIRLFLALASFFFAGYIAIYFLLLKKERPAYCDAGGTMPGCGSEIAGTVYSRPASFSQSLFIFFLSFYAGIFIISNFLMLLSMSKVKFSFLIAAIFTATCFLVFCIILIYKKLNNKTPSCFKDVKNVTCGKTSHILTAVTWFFIALCFAAVLFFTFLFPIRFWDAISCWSIKGRAFFIDGSITNFYAAHNYDFSHLSYPLYIPLSQTWIYMWLGYADERLVKILFPLFYLSLIFVLYYCFRKKFNKLASSLFVLMLCGLPVAMDHGYLEYTNLVFAIILFVAVYFFYLHVRNDMHLPKYSRTYSLRLLFTSALFFTMLAQIRSEGILFLVIFFISSTIFGIRKYIKIKKAERNCFIYSIFIPPVLSLILSLPWQVLKRILGLGIASTEWAELFSSAPAQKQAFDFAHASGAILSQFFYSAYDSARAFLGSSYGIIWAVLLILLIINIKKVFTGPNLVFAVFIIPGFIALFISLGLIAEFAWSTERYMLHLLPLTYFWILYNLPLFKKEPEPKTL